MPPDVANSATSGGIDLTSPHIYMPRQMSRTTDDIGQWLGAWELPISEWLLNHSNRDGSQETIRK